MSVEHVSDYLRKLSHEDCVYFERRGTNGAELGALQSVWVNGWNTFLLSQLYICHIATYMLLNFYAFPYSEVDYKIYHPELLDEKSTFTLQVTNLFYLTEDEIELRKYKVTDIKYIKRLTRQQAKLVANILESGNSTTESTEWEKNSGGQHSGSLIWQPFLRYWST